MESRGGIAYPLVCENAVDTNYIALAIPGFFLLIALESWASRRQGRRYYRLADSINDLATGVLQQLATLLFAALLVGGYLFVYAHLRVADLPAGEPWVWIACFVGVDLLYYWFHRLSHEVNFLWAAHVVHHQSEEYNLTVALRQSALQPFFSMVFYWPLAWLGFPPAVFLACASFNTLYQFWIHTRALGSLGPLERVFMTPSHHRVHHGRNPIYIDRNHGGTFIWWDKLFGTFEPEGEEVVYGITKPLASWNPLWANAQEWVFLWRAARATRRWQDKLLVFLKPPGWLPEDLGGFRPPPPIDRTAASYDPPVPRAIAGYALLQFAQVLALALLTLAWSATLPWASLALLSAAVIWGLLCVGALFDRARWAGACELARLCAMAAAALAWLPGALGPLLAVVLALEALLAWRLGVRWRASAAPGPGGALETPAADRSG